MLEFIGLVALLYLLVAGVWTALRLKKGATVSGAIAEGVLWFPWMIIVGIARGINSIRRWMSEHKYGPGD